MVDNTKKYWLKLEEGFLDSGHIKVLKAKENGKDAVLFLLSLMLKSIRDVGHLRFNAAMPYDDEMLAVITETDVATAKKSLATLKELGLVEVLEDKTLFLPSVPGRTGKECDSAERVRLHRARNGVGGELLQCNDNKEKNENVEVDEKKNNRKSKKSAPQSGMPDAILSSYTSTEELRSAIKAFVDMRKLIRKPMTVDALSQILSRLDTLTSNDVDKITILNNSVRNSWADIYPLKSENATTATTSTAKAINYDEE